MPRKSTVSFRLFFITMDTSNMIIAKKVMIWGMWCVFLSFFIFFFFRRSAPAPKMADNNKKSKARSPRTHPRTHAPTHHNLKIHNPQFLRRRKRRFSNCCRILISKLKEQIAQPYLIFKFGNSNRLSCLIYHGLEKIGLAWPCGGRSLSSE